MPNEALIKNHMVGPNFGLPSKIRSGALKQSDKKSYVHSNILSVLYQTKNRLVCARHNVTYPYLQRGAGTQSTGCGKSWRDNQPIGAAADRGLRGRLCQRGRAGSRTDRSVRSATQTGQGQAAHHIAKASL